MSRQSVKRFGGRDMLQHIDLARVLFGGMIPSRRDARFEPIYNQSRTPARTCSASESKIASELLATLAARLCRAPQGDGLERERRRYVALFKRMVGETPTAYWRRQSVSAAAHAIARVAPLPEQAGVNAAILT